MNEAIRLLQTNHYKITNQRKVILHYFLREDGYRSAKALLTYLNTIDDKISVDTIYRNLYLYADLGILEMTDLEGEKYFRFACSAYHHHHFICQMCGKTKEIPMCPMDELNQSLNGYHVSDHKFEIYGLCPTCNVSA